MMIEVRTVHAFLGRAKADPTPEHYPFQPSLGSTGCVHCGYDKRHHPTLQFVKALFRQGMVVTVTNHYITREDHPCFGTNTRTVIRVTRSHLYLAAVEPKPLHISERVRLWGGVPWPKASQIEYDGDLSIVRFFGGGVGQQPSDLFLTIRLDGGN